jgi:hypothetical protein
MDREECSTACSVWRTAAKRNKAKEPELVENRGAARLILTKQSQSAGRQNECKLFQNKELRCLCSSGAAGKQSQSPAFGRKSEALRNYLRTVTLSKAKGLSVGDERSRAQFARGELKKQSQFANGAD